MCSPRSLCPSTPPSPPALVFTITAHDSRSANMAFSSRFSFWEKKGSFAWTIYILALHGIAELHTVLTRSSHNECVRHICLFLTEVNRVRFEPEDTQLLTKYYSPKRKKERKKASMLLQFARCVISSFSLSQSFD